MEVPRRLQLLEENFSDLTMKIPARPKINPDAPFEHPKFDRPPIVPDVPVQGPRRTVYRVRHDGTTVDFRQPMDAMRDTQGPNNLSP
jgi:hypothetical protein